MAVGAQHGRQPAALTTQVRAQGHVLQHAALAQQAHVLEGAAQAQPGEVARGLAGHGLAHQAHGAAGGVVHAGDHVEEGALAGTVGADQRVHLAGLDVEVDGVVGHQAGEALGDFAGIQHHLAGGRQRALRQRRGGGLGAGAGRRPDEAACGAGDQRPQAVGGALQHQQHQEAEHHDLEVAAGAQQLGQHVLQLGLQQRDQRGAQHRAPQVARAADHGHEQVFDADVEVERRRVDEALQVRVEPARHRRQQRRQHEQFDALLRRVDAHRLGHHTPALERADGAALARIQQVVHGPDAQQQQHPDEHSQHARRGHVEPEQAERRQAAHPRVAAQRLQVAEDVIQAQTPGDGAQRQVVPRQAQRDRAQQPGDHRRHHQPQQQTQPGHQASRDGGQRLLHARVGGDPGRGVGAQADEGGLAEGGHAADPGQQHQAHGHHRIQADVVQQRDGERRQKGPGQRQQRDEDPCDVPGGHSSSSTWCVFIERHHSTGMIRVNTMTSLNALAQNDEKDSSCPTSSEPASASG